MSFIQSNLNKVSYLLIGVTVFTAVGWYKTRNDLLETQAQQKDVPVSSTKTVPVSNVVAFGQIAPKDEVISLSVPNAEDSRVNKILVEEGDWVEAGQVIAILQGIERKERDLEEALRNVTLHEARLKKIRSGDAKQAEIAAQEANIEGLKAQLQYETIERQAAIASVQAELKQTQLTYDRNKSLLEDGAISQEELDRAREQLAIAKALLSQRQAQLDNTLLTLEKQITQEEKQLATLKEVRPVDVEIAEAELAMAKVAVAQAKADLEDTKVKVPVAGRILRINTHVGERVDLEKGIIELGQTREMYAIAEVYETEITKIELGQPATIKSEYGGFTGEITGTVAQIGLQVGNQTLVEDDADPTTDRNARIVEVKIKIDEKDSKKIADLTGMQVRINIETDPVTLGLW